MRLAFIPNKEPISEILLPKYNMYFTLTYSLSSTIIDDLDQSPLTAQLVRIHELNVIKKL